MEDLLSDRTEQMQACHSMGEALRRQCAQQSLQSRMEDDALGQQDSPMVSMSKGKFGANDLANAHLLDLLAKPAVTAAEEEIQKDLLARYGGDRS
ncbi:hypothetical protein PRZ48_010658 [Zasmidium cellare]|uniref:Uncharacterized protein n=1 Tax=Zasmidium cellare TaxID=395010 RepID=A0ABR0E987_ZASCE|nr:hypothetical protein PRZ48_010658 [Zasmidium cellare]